METEIVLPNLLKKKAQTPCVTLPPPPPPYRMLVYLYIAALCLMLSILIDYADPMLRD